MPGKGQATSEAVKQKLRAAALGRKLTEATKQKIGKAHKGRKRPEGTGLKISAALKGQKRRPHTEEHKQKIGAALVGQKRTEATKQKMSTAAKGRKHTEEAKQKMSLTRKGRPAPWVRERLLGSTWTMSSEARVALDLRNKARRLPEAERKRRRQEINRHCQLKARYGMSAGRIFATVATASREST